MLITFEGRQFGVVVNCDRRLSEVAMFVKCLRLCSLRNTYLAAVAFADSVSFVQLSDLSLVLVGQFAVLLRASLMSLTMPDNNGSINEPISVSSSSSGRSDMIKKKTRKILKSPKYNYLENFDLRPIF